MRSALDALHQEGTVRKETQERSPQERVLRKELSCRKELMHKLIGPSLQTVLAAIECLYGGLHCSPPLLMHIKQVLQPGCACQLCFVAMKYRPARRASRTSL